MQETSAHTSPEVQMGAEPTPASGVYTLGILILQLLTGSEARGLLDHVQMAIDRGRISDILDPCAERISLQQALDLAKLALQYGSPPSQQFSKA